MEQTQQFWWNWWVNAAVAIATFLAVLTALFGPLLIDLLRSKWFPPLLRLRLLSEEGEKGKNRSQEGAVEDVRFYHLHVSNSRRHLSPAKEVQVFLVRVEEPGPGGSLIVTWASEIPMTWWNQQIWALTRTVGQDYDCDLCSVGKTKWLSLSPLIFPIALEARGQRACIIIASLQAKSNQVDSPICRFKIAWDGDWEDGDTEMKRHLHIEELRDI
jgi:hypothetical protein